jgi:hypothetical protein
MDGSQSSRPNPFQTSKAFHSAIIGIDILTKSGGHYLFVLTPSPPQKITMTYSTQELCEMPSQFLFPRGERGQSLVKEICHRGTSAHYLKVLELLKNR